MRHLAALLAIPSLAIAGSALAGDGDTTLRYTTITDYAFIGAPTNGQPNSGSGSWGSAGQFVSDSYNTPAAIYATTLFYGADYYDNYVYEGDRLELYTYNFGGDLAATGALLVTFTLSEACSVTKFSFQNHVAVTINGNSVAVGDLLGAGVHQIRFDVLYNFTSIDGTDLRGGFLTWDAAAVPAPGAAALLGLAGLVGRRRRR